MINRFYREREIPRLRYAEFTGKDGFNIERQKKVDNGVDGQHNENVAKCKIVIGGHATIQILPLYSFACGRHKE